MCLAPMWFQISTACFNAELTELKRFPLQSRELNSEQIRSNFCVAVFLRPKIERKRREFVDHGHRMPVLRHVHSLDVRVACIAGLHAHRRNFLRAVNGEFVYVLLAASRTDESPVVPFRRAQRTN